MEVKTTFFDFEQTVLPGYGRNLSRMDVNRHFRYDPRMWFGSRIEHVIVKLEKAGPPVCLYLHSIVKAVCEAAANCEHYGWCSPKKDGCALLGQHGLCSFDRAAVASVLCFTCYSWSPCECEAQLHHLQLEPQAVETLVTTSCGYAEETDMWDDLPAPEVPVYRDVQGFRCLSRRRVGNSALAYKRRGPHGNLPPPFWDDIDDLPRYRMPIQIDQRAMAAVVLGTSVRLDVGQRQTEVGSGDRRLSGYCRTLKHAIRTLQGRVSEIWWVSVTRMYQRAALGAWPPAPNPGASATERVWYSELHLRDPALRHTYPGPFKPSELQKMVEAWWALVVILSSWADATGFPAGMLLKDGMRPLSWVRSHVPEWEDGYFAVVRNVTSVHPVFFFRVKGRVRHGMHLSPMLFRRYIAMSDGFADVIAQPPRTAVKQLVSSSAFGRQGTYSERGAARETFSTLTTLICDYADEVFVVPAGVHGMRESDVVAVNTWSFSRYRLQSPFKFAHHVGQHFESISLMSMLSVYSSHELIMMMSRYAGPFAFGVWFGDVVLHPAGGGLSLARATASPNDHGVESRDLIVRPHPFMAMVLHGHPVTYAELSGHHFAGNELMDQGRRFSYEGRLVLLGAIGVWDGFHNTSPRHEDAGTDAMEVGEEERFHHYDMGGMTD